MPTPAAGADEKVEGPAIPEYRAKFDSMTDIMRSLLQRCVTRGAVTVSARCVSFVAWFGRANRRPTAAEAERRGRLVVLIQSYKESDVFFLSRRALSWARVEAKARRA